jgi:putative FmdB family regulatory protein
MPLYEFRCERCNQSFELRQTVDEHGRVRPECPQCHSTEHVITQLSVFQAVTSRKA